MKCGNRFFLALCYLPLGLGQTITTVAGNGRSGFSGDGGPATQAQLDEPRRVAVDSDGIIYIADWQNNRVCRVDPAGVISTFAGSGEYPRFAADPDVGDGGPAVNAKLAEPMAVAVDATGGVFILDSIRIRKVTADGVITTVAGGGIDPFSDNIPAINAQIIGALGLTVDKAGNIYVCQRSRIRKIDTAGMIATVTGNAYRRGYAGDGGPATEATFGDVEDVAVDPAGNLYIADSDNYGVRKVDAAGVVTTFAGTGTSGSSGDGGPATQAQIAADALTIDAAGNVYVSGDNRVRKITAAGIISTVAGGGNKDGDGIPATQAYLRDPSGLAVDSSGNVFTADMFEYRVRKVSAQTSFSQQVAANGIVNAGSFTGSLSPGALFSVFGSDLAPGTQQASSLPLPTALAGVSVTVNGVKAPLIYVSPVQINAQFRTRSRPARLKSPSLYGTLRALRQPPPLPRRHRGF